MTPTTNRTATPAIRSATPAIALDDVTFDYPGGVRALDGVSLAMDGGQRMAIVGQNGSGKSTLVRQLNGLLRPTTGRVLIDGEDVRDRHVAALARIVGLAFQNPDRQIFAGSVRAEVSFGPRNLRFTREELDRAVEDSLAAVGLLDERQTNPYDLGHSRRKLLGLASVLAMRTPVVVLDEPTTGQDADGVERVQEIVAAVAREGRTVIAVSHDMRFVAETFERVVVMRAGRIVLEGRPADVFAEPSWPVLESTFLEPPLAARIAARLGLPPVATETELVAALSDA
jgi:energy-coupling factor transporter ATP-binding protein EcfA2